MYGLCRGIFSFSLLRTSKLDVVEVSREDVQRQLGCYYCSLLRNSCPFYYSRTLRNHHFSDGTKKGRKEGRKKCRSADHFVCKRGGELCRHKPPAL